MHAWLKTGKTKNAVKGYHAGLAAGEDYVGDCLTDGNLDALQAEQRVMRAIDQLTDEEKDAYLWDFSEDLADTCSKVLDWITLDELIEWYDLGSTSESYIRGFLVGWIAALSQDVLV